MRRAALLVLLVGCGDNVVLDLPDAGDPTLETCSPPGGDKPWFDPGAEPCQRLSSYRFFSGGAAQVPGDGVVPYDLNTPLFSDYATKQRFLWLPLGKTMTYTAAGPFVIPVGAVLIKSFGYRADLRDPSTAEPLVETRLLVHRDDGWHGLVYVWNAEQTDAFLQVAGGVFPVSWIHTDGKRRDLRYIVPNINQCENCHVDGLAATPIGPRAGHLNRDFAYPTGTENQLTHLTALGYLTGAPADPADAPRTPVWDDPATGSVDARARALLDVNCSACHNPSGAARTSGLDLRASVTELAQYGVCKTPVAAGRGAGGFQYDIVPGKPDESILVFRMESVDPAIRMPELLRQTVHREGAALVRQWISEMTGACTAP